MAAGVRGETEAAGSAAMEAGEREVMEGWGSEARVAQGLVVVGLVRDCNGTKETRQR